MNELGFSKLSLRDLALLSALVESGKIAPVASAFRISPSAVSYAIDRLRTALNDELLVRTSHGFHPTLAGRQYAARAREFLAQIESVAQQDAFDPSTTAYKFVLLATEYELDGFLGRFVNRIASSRAQVQFVIEQASHAFKIDRLFDDVDLAFSPILIDRAGVEQKLLFSDPYVTFYDENSQSPPTSIGDFAAAQHAVMDPGGYGRSNVDDILEQQGYARYVRVVAPSFHPLGGLMRGSKMISTLPSRLADGAMHGFSHVTPPVEIPELKIFASFARNRPGNPPFDWLMQEIRLEISRG